MKKKKRYSQESKPLKNMAKQRDDAPRYPEWMEVGLAFLLKFERFFRDIGGILLLTLGALTLFSLIGLTSGVWLTPWAELLQRWLGWGSLFVVAVFGVAGLFLMQKQQEPLNSKDWRRVVWLEVAAFAELALMSLLTGNSLAEAEAGRGGGLVGWGVVEFLGIVLKPLPEFIAGLVRFLILLILFGMGAMSGFGLFGKVLQWLEGSLADAPAVEELLKQEQPAVVIGGADSSEGTKSDENVRRRKKPYIPPEFRKQFKMEDNPVDVKADLLERDDRLPSLDLLMDGESVKPDQRHINQTAGLIEKTLADFGIPAKVVGYKVGPTITQFAVEPGYLDRSGAQKSDDQKQKVRVAQISGLRRDLALALSAERLRIQAPVPGRSYIGIEVPNKKSLVVRLRPILETHTFHQLNSPLAIALGRDVSGMPLVTDLSRMPHLLIAGTTGSGKSVCIAAITACLLMNNTPEDLRIVMIDPKMVELVRFNGLPHLYGKVETKLDRISGVLRWVVMEMQQRYKLLEELRARNIESFNRKVKRRKEYEHMPRIVVLIDELADLMMSAAEQTEATIVRLAQMARAVGIHLVVATQRPSTDVVTGLIKANFPARLSFAVASGVDSRVILDMGGAESLLGRGDLLFLHPESSAPVRAQGAMISDKEIENIISYWQQTWNPEEIERAADDAPWEPMLEEQAMLSDKDSLVLDAIELVKETGRASTSMMQRRLRIGYPRAARLMDELEELGVVGPSRGGGREREVLVDSNGNPEDEEE